MGQAEVDRIILERRLDSIRRYITARVPFVPTEYHTIEVDKGALEGLFSQALATRFPFLPSRKCAELKELKRMLFDEFNGAVGSIPFFVASDLEHKAARPKRRLLMAAPSKLSNEGVTLREKAEVFEQWLCLRHALVRAGAHVDIIPASLNEGGDKEVFTRDHYVMIGNTAYLPDPQELQDLNDAGKLHTPAESIKSYRGEISQAEKVLNEHGIKTVMVKGAWFEGGNVVRHYSSKTIFVGIDGDWNSEDAAQKLLAAINRNKRKKEQWALLPVPLADRKNMYHLDTGMSEELPHGEVMIYPGVTDKKTYRKIVGIIGAQNVIKLDFMERQGLATNTIDVRGTFVLTGRSITLGGLAESLKEKGYTVIMPNRYSLREGFKFGRAGTHCMTNDLRQPHRKLRSSCVL